MVAGFAFESLASGIILGLVAGLSPGPMFALLIAEALKFGKGEGLKVAVSPLITDSAIILITLSALSTLAGHSIAIGLISVLGACYLIYLGLDNLRTKVVKTDTMTARKGALKRGIITNLLNPHTYLFWLSVGSPIILETFRVDLSSTISFLLGFFVFLVGSMAMIALIVDRAKSFVNSKYYSVVLRLLGVVLIAFASIILIEGLMLIASP